ncbi:uncharacterized protein At5g41620 isoform X2 [Manihot esculenta]|uniref:Uncharacterized protein n=1 Tax=Manihot esculenta TaxID=3983 RepID=A0A2C9WPC9_MANES|nr:uncharacterized protein At5g41620 isoform X2 [Manihot esculenta]OAY62213.1 hypothetical protein MANES_01G250400v8 [Manihot esculenta]
MEREEKGVERGGKGKKQQELEGREKFKRGIVLIGKRAGPSTPSSTWRLEFSSLSGNSSNNPVKEFLNTTTSLSARKLCANLWEVQPQLQLSPPKMTKNIAPRGARRRHHKANKPLELVDPPNNSPDQANTRPSRTHAAQSWTQHHGSLNRNSPALQPLSSVGFGGPMEVAPCNPKRSTSPLDFKGRTSTELIKVVNRIWSLEEQQACNLSLLKSLKTELDHSGSQIKELLKEKQANKREMDDLMKQVAEDKVVRKNEEHDRIKAVIQPAQEELEDERKLRKHSESLHRKLAREFSEVKSAFSNALKELERERKARVLLENLCDEFAKGIRGYEQEVRSLRSKPDRNHVNTDRLVLHISEAWLDERMQIKIAEARNDLAEKNTIVDKLGLDIEIFLQARHSNELKKGGNFVDEAINNAARRESFPLNEAVSAPRDAADEEDSIDSNSHCIEVNRRTGKEQHTGSSRRRVNSSSEIRFEEIVNLDATKRLAGSRENSKGRVLHARLKSNDVADTLVRNHSLSSEGDKIHPEGDLKEDACGEAVFAGHASPVQQWKSKLESPEFDKSESSLLLPRGIKENTLKAKLLEARLESQKSRSRMSKASL